MRDLQQIKKRVVYVLSVLGAVSVGFLVYLLWPGTSVSAQKEQAQNLQQQYTTLRAEVAPLDGIEGKLVQTRADIKDLYRDAIPNRSSQISLQLEKIAQAAGVQSQGVHYTTKPSTEKTDLSGFQRLDIDTTVTGEYPKLAHFINSIEQDKLLFVIDQISLTSQEGGIVTLQIRLHTYLKEAA